MCHAGFPWSGAVFAAVFAAQGVAIAILATFMPPEPKFDESSHGKLASISGFRLTPNIHQQSEISIWQDAVAVLANVKLPEPVHEAKCITFSTVL